jgi:nitroreductase
MTDQIGLFETMYSCRAMRRLHPDPVPEEQLLRLVDAANQACSGRNFQRGRWIIVRDDDQKQRVAELNRRASEEAAREQAEHGEPLAHHSVEKRRRMWEAVLWQSQHMHEAPAIIVACAVLDHPGQDPNRYASSIWPGIQNLLLAARSGGLGAVPTTYALRFRDELHEVLGLPNVRGRASDHPGRLPDRQLRTRHPSSGTRDHDVRPVGRPAPSRARPPLSSTAR